jgi:hypothetical protein
MVLCYLPVPAFLYMTKRFKVEGEKRLVELYKLKMTVERTFKAGKRPI